MVDILGINHSYLSIIREQEKLFKESEGNEALYDRIPSRKIADFKMLAFK